MIRSSLGCCILVLLVCLNGHAFQVGHHAVGVLTSRLGPSHLPYTRSASSPTIGALFHIHRSAFSQVSSDDNTQRSTQSVIRLRKLFLALWRWITLPFRMSRLSSNSKSSEANVLEVVEMADASTSSEVSVMETTTMPSLVETSVSGSAADAVASTVTMPRSKGATTSFGAKRSSRATTNSLPEGERWAVGTVDLSGEWELIVNESFKNEYDEYLKRLGQPSIVRSIALNIIGMTTEFTKQTDEGRTLLIRGTNARGVWERSLTASGADAQSEEYKRLHVRTTTADDEEAQSESWWQDGGTVHHSWMRGIQKYGGGDFESRRYLEENGNVLVCESVFHPTGVIGNREHARLTWKFLRKGAARK